MILIDANILLYAEDTLNPLNHKARLWLDKQLSDESPVCFCWTTINAFLRISTNRRVFSNPLTISQAISRVQSWTEQPSVRLIHPTDNHWDILKELIVEGQASANLVSDAHLAALAIEHGCILYSSDSDFSRFPKLKWKNPLK
ncbi:MAG TPA: PIN domain nuclease [Lentisphaeria bacterium]|nr:MAG: twitching motility protein PilT [Lentisphaerae bacterium GWF2_49_21]HBC87105.1 PIN domain nuclease [Lentisphaeria bacterium]